MNSNVEPKKTCDPNHILLGRLFDGSLKASFESEPQPDPEIPLKNAVDVVKRSLKPLHPVNPPSKFTWDENAEEQFTCRLHPSILYVLRKVVSAMDVTQKDYVAHALIRQLDIDVPSLPENIQLEVINVLPRMPANQYGKELLAELSEQNLEQAVQAFKEALADPKKTFVGRRFAFEKLRKSFEQGCRFTSCNNSERLRGLLAEAKDLLERGSQPCKD